MIKIITDSSANISQEEAKELGITVMPLTVVFGTEEFRDGIDLDCDKFYEMLETSKEFPHTAQLTEEQIEEAVKEALSQADEVIIMPLASVLSGTYERCKAVASRYENVYAYDGKCTTVMLKLMVTEALKHASESAESVMNMLDNLRPKLKLYAVLNTLENLKKGGRLSGAAALLGTLLKIKPVISFDLDGKVEVVSKSFGMIKGIDWLVAKIDKSKIDCTKPVYLIYTQNDANSLTLFKKLGVEYSESRNICPAIGTHIGADACGIVYAEK